MGWNGHRFPGPRSAQGVCFILSLFKPPLHFSRGLGFLIFQVVSCILSSLRWRNHRILLVTEPKAMADRPSTHAELKNEDHVLNIEVPS